MTWPHGWLELDSGCRRNLSATWSDGRSLIIVGAGGTVLRSQDRGTTVAKVASGSKSMLLGVGVTAEATLLAVGEKDAVLESSDDGASWIAAATGQRGRHWNAVAATREATILVGQGLVRRRKGATAWTAATTRLPPRGRVFDVVAGPSGTLYAVGAAGKRALFLRSDDHGDHWESTPLPAEASLAGPVVLDGQVLIPSDRGRLYRSVDDGRSWTTLTGPPGDASPQALRAVRGSWYLLDASGGLWHSRDDGGTWTKLHDSYGGLEGMTVDRAGDLFLHGVGGWLVRGHDPAFSAAARR